MPYYNGDKGEDRKPLNPVRAMDAGGDLNLPLPEVSIEKERLIIRLSLHLFLENSLPSNAIKKRPHWSI